MSIKDAPLVKCKSCGWIHFEVNLEYIKKWEEDWKEFWKTLDKKGREDYGVQDGPPKPDSYYRCFRCHGNYKDFKNVKDKDVPIGVTIQPILNRSE